MPYRTKNLFGIVTAIVVCLTLLSGSTTAQPVSLFDGSSFSGWEGNTNQVWRIRDGVIVGGSLSGNPQNEFLATTSQYRNFRLTLEYRLVGTEGFVNGGVQFHSRRIEDPPNEMIGYQADIGAGFSGSLYDESRRRTMLVRADEALIEALEKPGEWNRYEVVAVGPQVSLFLNGQRTAVFVEDDASIELSGHIALQIHGDCKAEISFRNIEIERLPDSTVPPPAEIRRRFGDAQPGLSLAPFPQGQFTLGQDEVVVLVGQENFVREQEVGSLEARLATSYAALKPRFRSMAWEADTVYEQWRDLNFGGWTDQLEAAGATMIVAQFGQMEAFDGVSRLTEFKAAYHRLLDQFAPITRRHVLISPMPFEKPLAHKAPDLRLLNADVAAYVQTIREIAQERNAAFVDLFSVLEKRSQDAPRLTKDGIHLTEEGLEVVAEIIADQLGSIPVASSQHGEILAAIAEKNRVWFDCWRPANWSFVYGDRISQRYGKSGGDGPSLKESFEERRRVVEASDKQIHHLALGETVSFPSRLRQGEGEVSPPALSPGQQLATFTVASGYEVNLYASESLGVVNPTQFSWDEQGRLYVACSPSYPQSSATALPADYILVLEDTDHDGQADHSWKAVENLTMVQGMEPGPDGLYVCDFDQLLYCRDLDGDGRSDRREVIFSGFGIGDTHQLINSISHGPNGNLWFTQGLHAMSVVETPWGIKRLDRSGVWRLRPHELRLESYFGGGMAGMNCWGVVFDDYGQVFHKSGDRPEGYWTVPGMVRGGDPLGSGDRHIASVSYQQTPQQYHSVGPLFSTSPKTTSIDIIGTAALPEAVQGMAVIGGYFGAVVELHRFHDAGSGFRTTQHPKLMRSNNAAFRPVDVSVGPDGAIYLADWYNPVIGHYQASYADPRRDKHHGRIWRVSAKGYAPVRPPALRSMSEGELLEQLRSPERWVRYQAKRLLFYRSTPAVIAAADRWVQGIVGDAEEERLLLEAIGVYQAHYTVRAALLKRLLTANDFRVRAYGVRVLAEWQDRLETPLQLLRRCAKDEHPRVRLEAVVAATYFPEAESIAAVTPVLEKEMDPFIEYALRLSARTLQPGWAPAFVMGALKANSVTEMDYLNTLVDEPEEEVSAGEELYTQACLACHQEGGKGLPGVYPPLEDSDWVTGDKDRLIKIVLNGLQGAIHVNGRPFESSAAVPMPGFAGLTDRQIADVLTYVRHEFGVQSSAIEAEDVAPIRRSSASRTAPWTEDEL